MTQKERMLAGKLYIAKSDELAADMAKARKITRLLNNSTEDQVEQRIEWFQELFGSVGERIWVEPPFRCDYGCHITIGNDFYANYDCIMIDVCDINIGDNVFFGPRVCIYTAGHPIDGPIRREQYEFGKKVTIGNDVWVGGNTVINPGVTIGDNVVIGSGSIVTKDIPAGVIAVGNPCRVLRPINDDDRVYWQSQVDQYKKEMRE